MTRTLCIAALALCSGQALGVTSKVLDLGGQTLTAYAPAAATPVQGLSPRHDQRGVDVDGTLRSPAPLGWAVAADPLGGGYGAGRTVGDVNLLTGGYHPTEVDLALPALGLPIVIGRAYNNLQVSAGNAIISSGPQGSNWSQLARPELVLTAGSGGASDTLTLVYGADRYVEFARIGETGDAYKAKNGAAGVVLRTAGSETVPETFTYYDQRGNATTFLGFNDAAGAAKGQLWKMTDPAGRTSYVGSASSPSSAVSSGYDSAGRMLLAFDASGRKYEFAYAAVDGVTRLTGVVALVDSGGTWSTVASVAYGYYSNADGGTNGLSGDLRTATVTMKGTGSIDHARTRYYRYYTQSHLDSAGRRGQPGALRLVVGSEGVRRYNADVSANGYLTATDTALLPYADALFEYNSDRRLKNATLNGSCGCSGGTTGLYQFAYQDVSSAPTLATRVANTSYDQGWARRTVVTQHFDETGQVLTRVLTSGDPAGSPAKTWVTDVVRDASGLVTEVRTPAAVASGYVHATGAVTASGTGMVTVYGRVGSGGTGNLAGLKLSTSVKSNGSTTVVLISDVTLYLGSSTVGVVAPVVATSSVYPETTAQETSYNYTYWANESTTTIVPECLVAKTVRTDSPVVSHATNGSGTATSTYQHARKDRSVAFTVDQTGVVTYTRRNGFGQAVTRVQDASTSGSYINSSTAENDAASAWTGLASSGTLIEALTTTDYDAQGRVVGVEVPSVSGSSRKMAYSYLALADGRLATFAYPRVVSTTFYGPVSLSIANNAGKTERRATIPLAGGAALTSVTPSITWAGMVDSIYDQTGSRLLETRTYTDITTGPALYDSATYAYDDMGRVIRSVDATQTIRRTVFEERGLPVERSIGTNDAGLPGSTSSGTSNMVTTEKLEYDGASSTGGGNGHLTRRTLEDDGVWSTTTDQRVTTIHNDYRGRAIAQVSPLPPHSVQSYDNLNRPRESAQYGGNGSGLSASSLPTTTTSRVAFGETRYDARGQVYQTVRGAITQSSGVLAASQVTDNWYDPAGRLIKTHGPEIVKTTYDRLGRVTRRAVVGSTDDATTATSARYTDAGNLTGDRVVEEQRIGLEPKTGRPRLQYTVQRLHTNASGTGALDSNTSPTVVNPSSLSGRAQITAMWYDALDRVTDTAAIGTNGGSTYTYTTSAPARSTSSPIQVTSYAYDDLGRVLTATNPLGVPQRTEFDFAGRRTRVIDNYANGVPNAGVPDEDRVVEYAYSAGRVASVTRVMPDPAENQVTSYTYEVRTGTGSKINANHILSSVTYPEQTTGQTVAHRSTTYAVNAQGQVIATTDPAGNGIATLYDKNGRVVTRAVESFAGGFDDRVERIVTQYDARGLVGRVWQSSTSDEVLDETAFTYDSWGNLATQVQDPDSALNTAGTASASGRAAFTSSWAHSLNALAEGRRIVHPIESLQPGGVVLAMSNGSSLDLAMKRTVGLVDLNTSAEIATYSYMGAASVVGTAYAEPQIATNLFDDNGSHADFLDNHNRPTTTRWHKTAFDSGGTEPRFVDFESAYDQVGNPLWIRDNVLRSSSGRSFDRKPGYDSLRRVTSLDEGQLNTGATAIATRSRYEALSRAINGRIVRDSVDLNGNLDSFGQPIYDDGPPGAYDLGEMDDLRVYNKRNELRSRLVADHASGGATVTLDYDRNGSLTSDGERHRYVFNPFGQLVRILDYTTSEPVAEFAYSGLGHRISEKTDIDDSAGTGIPDGTLDGDDPTFYIATDSQGRRVATFREGDTHPKETFVWTPAGVSGPGGNVGGGGGALILRDRVDDAAIPSKWANEAAGESRPERHYHCSDSRQSVVALIGLGEGGDGPTGVLAEQYRYSATGVPYGIPLGDVNADGRVQVDGEVVVDSTIIADIEQEAVYQVRADLDLDGLVDSDDIAIADAAAGAELGRGRLSAASVRSTAGLGQLERLLLGGPGWSTGSGAYREDISVNAGQRASSAGDFRLAFIANLPPRPTVSPTISPPGRPILAPGPVGVCILVGQLFHCIGEELSPIIFPPIVPDPPPPREPDPRRCSPMRVDPFQKIVNRNCKTPGLTGACRRNMSCDEFLRLEQGNRNCCQARNRVIQCLKPHHRDPGHQGAANRHCAMANKCRLLASQNGCLGEDGTPLSQGPQQPDGDDLQP